MAKPTKRPAKKQPRRAPAKKSTAARRRASIPEERVRLRAYLIYERRGRTPGRELEDWAQAEAELLAEQSSTD
jgi:hypothetical protein